MAVSTGTATWSRSSRALTPGQAAETTVDLMVKRRFAASFGLVEARPPPPTIEIANGTSARLRSARAERRSVNDVMRDPGMIHGGFHRHALL